MNWNILGNLVVFVLILGLAGCASARKRRAHLQEVESRGVEAAVYARVKKARTLDLGNIEHLTAKGVPNETILFFLEWSRAVYSLRTRDIERLRKANVSDGVIDFLLATSTQYDDYYGYGCGYPHYGHGPHHFGYRRYHGHGYHH